MTQFSVGVPPHQRHSIVVIHCREQPAVQKDLMSDRKGVSIAFHPEEERAEKNCSKHATMTSDSALQG